MDVVALARTQFAITILFHYLFPPLTIGLGLVIVWLELGFLRTGEAIYETAARFWTRLFAINFALGVATGVVMEFQFGSNWAVYSRYVGDVFGSALAAEGIFAFFLEAGFLSVLVFGWDRVSPRVHFTAALLVFLGAIFSSVWITVANSWQQTPAGFARRLHMLGGIDTVRAEVTDFWAVVFNPSSVDRLIHVWFGAFLLGAFFVMSISAFYLLRGRHEAFARRSFVGALQLGLTFSLLQVVSGDFEARMIGREQPAKLAAFEGLYRGEDGAGIHVFGWPDDAAGEVRGAVTIPRGLSLLATHDPSAHVRGLAELEPVYGRPPVWISFQAFHLMVAIGFFFVALTVAGTMLLRGNRIFGMRWLLWIFVGSVALAFLANEIGWVAAEVGRQPWVVYPSYQGGKFVPGLRTAEAVSEAVSAGAIRASIAVFGVIYLLLGWLWIALMNDRIQKGPQPAAPPSATLPGGVEEAATRLVGERSLTREEP